MNARGAVVLLLQVLTEYSPTLALRAAPVFVARTHVALYLAAGDAEPCKAEHMEQDVTPTAARSRIDHRQAEVGRAVMYCVIHYVVERVAAAKRATCISVNPPAIESWAGA